MTGLGVAFGGVRARDRIRCRIFHGSGSVQLAVPGAWPVTVHGLTVHRPPTSDDRMASQGSGACRQAACGHREGSLIPWAIELLSGRVRIGWLGATRVGCNR